MEEESLVSSRVEQWLVKEGYPLEFAVSSAFRKAGFRTAQGTFARSRKAELPREVDVDASYTRFIGRESFVRVHTLAECKWSADKPWVIFVDDDKMHPNAVVAQSIASEVGHSALWMKAADSQLHECDCFSVQEMVGFNGRQAFSSNKDYFYTAIQSIVDKSVTVAEHYDDYLGDEVGSMMGVVVLPVVVVSGVLYEAAYSEKAGSIKLREVDRVKVRWRGADRWNLHATVEVVREDALQEFCKRRYRDSRIIATSLERAIKQFRQCLEEKSLKPLEVSAGPRGVVGCPRFLKKLEKLIQADK